MPATSDPCFVVTGPFRSGTSLVARLLGTLGAFAGPTEDLYEPSDWNPAGYIQRPDITAFNKRLIAQAGGHDGDPGAPEAIAAAASIQDFASLDLSWMRRPGPVVVKDPRFCFTLLTWLRHGAFGDRNVRLVITSRQPADMIRSALSHYDVKHYCGNTPEGAQRTLAAYEAGADWHAAHAGLPALAMHYAMLDREPAQAVETLAAFMGVADPGAIAAAKAACGRGRSQAGGKEEA
jgi:LPS sulfotransferase NodH